MKINLLLLNFIGVTLLLFSCQNRSSSRASAEDFFQTSEKTNFEISPSGKYISFLKEHEGLRNIFVLEISSGKIERITNSDNLHIRSAFWANDRELIFLLDRGLDDNLRLMSVNRESQQTRLILDLSSARMRWVEPIQVVN